MKRMTSCSPIASAIASRMRVLGHRSLAPLGSSRDRAWIGTADLGAEDGVDEPVLLDAAHARERRWRRRSARKWSPPPVRSSTSARGTGDGGLDALLELVGAGHLADRVASAIFREADRRHAGGKGMITFTEKGAEKVQEFLAAQSADVADRRPARRRARRRLLRLPVRARVRHAARRRRGLRGPRPAASSSTGRASRTSHGSHRSTTSIAAGRRLQGRTTRTSSPPAAAARRSASRTRKRSPRSEDPSGRGRLARGHRSWSCCVRRAHSRRRARPRRRPSRRRRRRPPPGAAPADLPPAGVARARPDRGRTRT